MFLYTSSETTNDTVFDEIWRDIKGYEGLYQVSTMGQVRSLDRFVNHHNGRALKKGKVLQLGSDKVGYQYIILHTNGQPKIYSVHRLVAIHFIPNPFNKPTVNHIDEVKNHNWLSNLEWMTVKENTNHGTRNERSNLAQRMPVVQLTMNNEFIKVHDSVTNIPGFNGGAIAQVCKGKYSQHKGYHWRYYHDYI